jgi:HEPN domain-containing protein
MAKNKGSAIRLFLNVALQRFEDAQILLNNNRSTGALYLAGYAVECALKAMLLANSPVSEQSTIIDSFRGKIGHNFESLKHKLQIRGVHFPPEIAKNLRRVGSWSPELRYVAGRQNLKETQAFVEATVQVIQWVERSL